MLAIYHFEVYPYKEEKKKTILKSKLKVGGLTLYGIKCINCKLVDHFSVVLFHDLPWVTC